MNDQVLLCKVLKIILGSRFYGSLGCLVCQLILPKVRDKFNLKNQLYFKCVFIANRIRNTVDVIPWCWSVGDKTDLFHSAFGQPFRKAKTIVSGNELIWQSRGEKQEVGWRIKSTSYNHVACLRLCPGQHVLRMVKLWRIQA